MSLDRAVAFMSAAVVVAGIVIGGGLLESDLAQSAPTPTPVGVPLTVTIPGPSKTPSPTPTATPSPSPSSSSTSGPTGGEPTGNRNEDGSPIPATTPSEDAGDLILDRETIIANEWMIATGSSYKAGEKVQIVLYPGAIVIGSYLVEADGTFSARFRIPADTRAGSYIAEATGWVSLRVTNEGFDVVTPALSDAFPYLWWVYVVVGTLLLGIFATIFFFRRSISRSFGSSDEPVGSVP